MEIQETYFLHGISFAEELALLLLPATITKKRGQLYLSKINNLTKRLQKIPNIELALGWVGSDIFKFIADHIEIRVIHAPFVDGTHKVKVQGTELFADIVDYNTTNRNKLKKMLYLIANSKDKLSPTTVIFHPVPYNISIRSEEQLLDNMYKMLKEVCSFLVDNNIFLTIENMPWLVGVSSPYTEILGRPEFFVKFFELCKCKNVGMTFDFGHANSMARYLWLKGELTSEKLLRFHFPLRFTEELSSRIYHVHFHYNTAHLPNSKPILSQTITKFKNYDMHNKVQGFKENEWALVRKGFNNILNHRVPLLEVGARPTVTLEVAPRSFNSLDAYFNDMEIFKDNIMVKYQDNKKNKLIKGKYGRHFKS